MKEINLLILTQKVNKDDSVLGFFHNWIAEFAERCQKVTVICLEEGNLSLPPNVTVLSLGKEAGKSKVKYLFNFFKYIIKERKNYNSVFVHMNFEYVLLGAIFWKLFSKKIGLWYAHGKTSFGLWLAAVLSDVIFTSTKSGFRINNSKVRIVGQGIDTNKFVPDDKQKDPDKFRIISIGRISPIKNYEIIIKALSGLGDIISDMEVTIIGGSETKDQQDYLSRLLELVKDSKLEGVVRFAGPMPNDKIVGFLQKADLFTNGSYTGSLDKVMPEAMACGLPVLSCNDSFKETVDNWEDFFFEFDDSEMLRNRIKYFYGLKKDNLLANYSEKMRAIVVNNHNLSGLIKKITDLY